MKPAAPVKREWPKMATGPLGNSAVFHCRGDVPHGWVVAGDVWTPPVVDAVEEEPKVAAKPKKAKASAQ